MISCSFSPVGFKGAFDFHTGHRVGAFFGLSVNPAKGGGFPVGFKTFHGSDGVGFFFSSFSWQQFRAIEMSSVCFWLAWNANHPSEVDLLLPS